MRELRHWPSIAGMLPESLCGIVALWWWGGWAHCKLKVYVKVYKLKRYFLFLCFHFYIYVRTCNGRGVELVKTVISQLVPVAVIFKRVLKFWISQNLHVSNMFFFTMMSLILSRLSCFKLIKIRPKKSSIKVWLMPNWTSAFSFWNHNTFFPQYLLEPVRFTNFSMMINSEIFLKLSPCCRKCVQASKEWSFFLSFLQLLNLILNVVSTSPTRRSRIIN